MVFSSLVFISIFLPAVLLLHILLPSVRAKNVMLLLASLIFYTYGEPVYVLLMVGTSLVGYTASLLMDRENERIRKLLLGTAVGLELGPLVIFKYSGMFTVLPIGISFFTFQNISYVIDVYRRTVKPQRNFAKVLLYISFFPQLIAGPIVKYRDIREEIDRRQTSTEGIYKGILRFVTGLSKKVLIANVMAGAADAMYGAPMTQIGTRTAWLGAVSYMLQIYFDFSGYSDMAIGMGWMFGFHFRENFNYPYIADSIRDFWRRWHISLSNWFKDYVYIPLGGNRKGRARTVCNKMIVFLATGLWHGANWTFLFWGAYHGFFMMLEELFPSFFQSQNRLCKMVRHIYSVLVVLIGFVFFRVDTIGEGFAWIRRMFTWYTEDCTETLLFAKEMTPLFILTLGIAIIASTPLLKMFWEKVKKISYLPETCCLAGYVLCMLSLAGGGYNPFIYFRF